MSMSDENVQRIREELTIIDKNHNINADCIWLSNNAYYGLVNYFREHNECVFIDNDPKNPKFKGYLKNYINGCQYIDIISQPLTLVIFIIDHKPFSQINLIGRVR